MLDIIGDIEWTKWIFQRGLGAVYLIAFLVTANQFRALIGARGLDPAKDRMSPSHFWRAPSVFHFWGSDRVMTVLAWLGVILAAAATFGLSEQLGTPASMVLWFLLWAIYLSFVNVGGTFYGFGWESMTLEAGFLAIFLGAAGSEAPEIIMWMVRWMLFRVMFGAGLIKLRGDPCWRDLTCLQYHHETQPIPGPFSWYFHHAPKWMHKMEVLGNHFLELVVPFFYFAPPPYSYAAGIITIIFHAWLIISGNFSWLNWFTIVLAIPLFDDAFFQTILPLSPIETISRTFPHNLALGALTVLIGLLSIRPLMNLFSRFQMMNTSFDPFHLVNTYGAFGSITKTRYEVIVEGTDESTLSPTTVWKEYEFKRKPGNVARRPAQVAPYHLRLDWLMWFAAMGSVFENPWLVEFALKLLHNDRETLKLLRLNPFPQTPPRFVRMRLFHYRFTTPQEKRATGHWWHRELVGEYLSPLKVSAGA